MVLQSYYILHGWMKFFITFDVIYLHKVKSSLDVSKISSSHWIFYMKSDSSGDIHLAHIEKKNQISRASNLSTHRRFVLVWAGLARAVGWKTMAMRWSVRGSRNLVFFLNVCQMDVSIRIWLHVKYLNTCVNFFGISIVHSRYAVCVNNN